MKIKYSIILFFCLQSLIGFTQSIKGFIADEKSKKGIAFVNLVLKNKNIGVVSNENGRYSFNIKENVSDTLQISCIGYQTRFIPLNQFKNKSFTQFDIFLKEDLNTLEDVILIVKKSKYTGLKTLGVNVKKKYSVSTPYGYETCVFIENVENKEGKVNEVSFFVRKKKPTKIYVSFPIFFRVKFYKYDKTTQKPGILLSFENIIIKPKNKTSKIRIDLKRYNILLPKEGICVGIERIKPSNIKLPKTTLYTTFPSLVWTHNNTPSTWNSFRGKEWTKRKRKSGFKKELFTNPLVHLKVQYRK